MPLLNRTLCGKEVVRFCHLMVKYSSRFGPLPACWATAKIPVQPKPKRSPHGKVTIIPFPYPPIRFFKTERRGSTLKVIWTGTSIEILSGNIHIVRYMPNTIPITFNQSTSLFRTILPWRRILHKICILHKIPEVKGRTLISVHWWENVLNFRTTVLNLFTIK